ncbi:uncharacterized protein LOC134272869 [Saccostrea cucullata]|uniref:uncharacterized protein LOC134272869 n=1 Tax=Saccostrea cuccullata TaxID=36930 RepID=UPI002ED19019
MMKRRYAVPKTGPSDIRSRTRDFSLTGHRKRHQRQLRDLRLSWLFLGLLVLFSPFLPFNSSNNSHFSTAKAETSSQGDSLCPTTFASVVSEQGTGNPTAQRERPIKVNDKYTVPTRRLDDTVASLQKLVKSFPKVTARELARVVGKIMSMSPVMGNICSIMTRFCSIEIACRKSWDDIIVFTHKNEVLNEYEMGPGTPDVYIGQMYCR